MPVLFSDHKDVMRIFKQMLEQKNWNYKFTMFTNVYIVLESQICYEDI